MASETRVYIFDDPDKVGRGRQGFPKTDQAARLQFADVEEAARMRDLMRRTDILLERILISGIKFHPFWRNGNTNI